MTRYVALLVALGGCNQVFGLGDEAGLLLPDAPAETHDAPAAIDAARITITGDTIDHVALDDFQLTALCP